MLLSGKEEPGGDKRLKAYMADWELMMQDSWVTPYIAPTLEIVGDTKNASYIGWKVNRRYARHHCFAVRVRHFHAARDIVWRAIHKLQERHEDAGVKIKISPWTFPVKVMEWLSTGIPEDERDNHEWIRLTAPRRV